ncbi:AmmeMemoRadiSam system radical SAM enzyme [Fusobacterium sp. PH5-44]|uniref:AmmeMemoRadiSam system radical SAM enzyme n=1 Tax=unclassified Fusobacterium TaxID=2648384 RepID=UPI003D1F1737
MMVSCNLCPRHCNLDNGQIGFCRGRANLNDKIICVNYGKITSIALDPIEKKPLRNFHAGKTILSIGSYGCNFRCGFCQNYAIAHSSESQVKYSFISPELLINRAIELKKHNNIGIAYTYNEPLIGYEYIMDCVKLAHKHGLKNILVTNGYICEEYFKVLLPFIDAFNIDLKGFNDHFYKMIGGDLNTVKKNITLASERTHVELTTLIIPELNDSPEEIEKEAKWIASINKNIPLHISRFFPCYKMTNISSTSIEKVFSLARIASKYLNYVYIGNC